MGFYSFLTQDTERSIANRHSSRKTFTVYMKDDKGNEYREDSYEGYGYFGDVDFYDFLVEMNPEILGTPEEGIQEEPRELYFDKVIGMTAEEEDAFNASLKWPSLSESPDHVCTGEEPIRCPDQGFFYNDPEPEFKPTKSSFSIDTVGKNSIDVLIDGVKIGSVEVYGDALPHLDLDANHFWFKAEYSHRYMPEFHSDTALQVLTKLQAELGFIQ